MTLPGLSHAVIRQNADPEVFHRGQDYLRRGTVVSLIKRGDEIQAEVEGSEPAPYVVRVAFDDAGVTEATCTCPYDWGGWCKHVVAALLAYLDQPAAVEERPPIASLLDALDRDQLRGLVLNLIEAAPDLADSVERAALALGSGPAPPSGAAPAHGAASSSRRTPVDTAAIRREVSASLHSLDRMRRSEAYWHVGGVVSEVETTVGRARAFLEAGDADSALAILEAVTDEYLAGWEMLDDSDGDASSFFERLDAVWTEALLSADLSADDRETWVEKLEAWADDLADYGLDASFAAAITAAREGWDDPLLARVLAGEPVPEGGERTERAEDLDEEDEDEAWDGEDWGDVDELDLEVLTAARLKVLERQGRYEEYLRLAAYEGLAERRAAMLVRLDRLDEAVAEGLTELRTADEALSVARALREHGAPREALRVAEHGLTLGGRKAALAGWLRDLAAGLGETERALAAATIAVEADPDLAAYLRTQELAGDRWPEHREALLAKLRRIKSSYPNGQVAIFLHEGLVADAIEAVKDSYAYELVANVAEAAVSSHPDWVISTCRKHAERIMDEGRASHYHDAVEWLATAKRAYLAADRRPEWSAYLEGLIDKHQRKYKLRPMLEALRR